jgi:universal stress protein G
VTLFRNILVALDVADPVNADRAIDSAKLIAGASGANVHLLHVRLNLPRTYARLLPESFHAEEKKDCDAAMERWVERLALPEERVTRTLRRGSVSHEVMAEAEQRRADLIVLGSRAPSFGSRMMGSNATAIVRDAKVSVLVVRVDDDRVTDSEG